MDYLGKNAEGSSSLASDVATGISFFTALKQKKNAH